MHLNMERLALGQLKDANIKFSNQIFPWYVRTQLCIPSSEYNRRTFRNGKSVGPWRWWGWEGCLVGPLEERNPAELGGGGGRRKSGNSISASYVIGLTEASSTAQLVLMTLHTSGSPSSSPNSSAAMRALNTLTVTTRSWLKDIFFSFRTVKFER